MSILQGLCLNPYPDNTSLPPNPFLGCTAHTGPSPSGTTPILNGSTSALDGNVTWSRCQDFCTVGTDKTGGAAYRYFAIENGNSCHCGDIFVFAPEFGSTPQADCENAVCSGSAGQEYCGGVNKMVTWEADAWVGKTTIVRGYVGFSMYFGLDTSITTPTTTPTTVSITTARHFTIPPS
ncbi:hypothetical protein B0J11DRAFT_508726 [Dendryphion nanum]|uniref:WSC domain-containing protein n=1 Tax=Dendryphion nanum TaxID=256645 RepID=A0A9P9IFI0_9PLEO|nr:hypothetical protein B0J11DRAFT_508726 [Dendryphion nanum]